ncbi:NAD(P)-dependent oxidoreductase [Promicromonospora sp. NPDC050249]|uniref:NAD-dependent epimerase/dehydratase family protein n=1 Tax=Promicromonospora sp. NPDC050249 TaxID=3154743 RepID=UPI003406DAD4
MQLPITAGVAPDVPRRTGNRVLVTGACGVIGRVIAEHLGGELELHGIDIGGTPHPAYVSHTVGSVADVDLVSSLVDSVDVVIHLATGVLSGWDGLQTVEIDGTRAVVGAAVEAGTRRLILASSTHSIGWYERDWLDGRQVQPVRAESPIRPDGMYGAAKAFAEATVRFANDWSGLPVSVLRIGTMRAIDDPVRLIESDELSYLGFGKQRRDRLMRSWLFHGDLAEYVREELRHPTGFRLRAATSTPDGQQWDHAVFTGEAGE